MVEIKVVIIPIYLYTKKYITNYDRKEGVYNMEEEMLKSITKKAEDIIEKYGKKPFSAEELADLVNKTMTDREIRFMATNDFVKLCKFINYTKHKKQQDKKQYKDDLAFQ